MWVSGSGVDAQGLDRSHPHGSPRRPLRGHQHEDQTGCGELGVTSTDGRYTVIEVSGLDRPGLLYELTNALQVPLADIAAATGRSVAALKVATHRGIASLRHWMAVQPAG